MKYYKVIGLLACVGLVISCFLPWAYYPDLNKSFTGFFTEKNIYGKPGIAFSFFAAASLVLIFVNKIWAKRTLIFLAALNLGYLLKTFVIFTSCYKGYCPRKEYGLYCVMISSVILLLVSFFPDVKLAENEKTETDTVSEP